MPDKDPGGQPQYFKTPEEMQVKIDDYFVCCKEEEEPITITGLCLHIGFTSRQALINYEGYSKDFFDTIKKAKLKIEMAYEKRLIHRGNGGDIFALKNFDWTDKQEINNRHVDKDGEDISLDDKKILKDMGLI